MQFLVLLVAFWTYYFTSSVRASGALQLEGAGTERWQIILVGRLLVLLVEIRLLILRLSLLGNCRLR